MPPAQEECGSAEVDGHEDAQRAALCYRDRRRELGVFSLEKAPGKSSSTFHHLKKLHI